MIQVPESEFKSLVQGMKKMQGELASMKVEDGKPKLAKQVTDRAITVCFVNNKPVIGYVNRGTEDKPSYIYEGPNPARPTEYILFVDVILKGEKDPLKLQYIEFVEQSEKHECLVTGTRKEPWETVSGTTDRVTVPEGAYYMTPTGVIVPLEVRGVISFYTVTLPDGTSLELHERYANISK